MEKNEFEFSSKETLFIKGVAILLMITNHLYPIQEWIYHGNEFIGIQIGQKSLEAYIGSFGKICVGIFAFLSGFGLWYIYSKRGILKGYIYNIKKLSCFLRTYWIIMFAIYIPVMEYIGIYRFDIKELCLNLLAYKTTYIRVAWYVRFYLELILTFPIYIYILNFIRKNIYNYNSIINEIILIICIYILRIILDGVNINLYLIEYLEYTPIVILGYSFAAHSIFLKINVKVEHFINRLNKFIRYIIWGTIISIIFILRGLINEINNINMDIIYVPIFIYILLKVKNEIKSYILNRGIILLGVYSTELWFLHAIFFIGDYNIQKIAYWPKISIIILIWVLVLLVPIAILINKLSIAIRKQCSKLIKLTM